MIIARRSACRIFGCVPQHLTGNCQCQSRRMQLAASSTAPVRHRPASRHDGSRDPGGVDCRDFSCSALRCCSYCFMCGSPMSPNHIAHSTVLPAADAKGDSAPRLCGHLRRLRQRIVALDTAMISWRPRGREHLRRGVFPFCRGVAQRGRSNGPVPAVWHCADLHGRRADRLHRRQRPCLAWFAPGRPTAAHGRRKIETLRTEGLVANPGLHFHPASQIFRTTAVG